METRINLDGGKYAVIHDNGADLRAERYGEPWRSLTGDGLVLALAQRVEELEAALAGMVAQLGTAPYMNAEEKPSTAACHHFAETCPSCEWTVGTWKAVRAARAALPK